MAYSRDYPNSIIPKGSKVVECLQNDDKELKRILSILSDIGVMSLFGSKRQCVLYAATGTDGKPSYLTATGLNVAINGSATPVIVTFAGGYNANGTVDKTDTIVDTVNAWTMPANGTYYLYIDKDMSTGILSYGYTTIPDTYATTAPASPVLDQCYFNTVDMKMYHYNSSAWEQKLRVFVAKAVTTADTATLTIYPFTSRTTASNFIQYDGNGNLQAVDLAGALTQFSASKFIGTFKGDIVGNADTATKALVADKCTGNADTATKATNDKNGADIAATYFPKTGGTISGDITAHSFNGTLHGTADNANTLGGYSLADSNTGNWGIVPLIKGDGTMEIGRYIDWHAANGDTVDYTSRFTAEDNGTVTVGTINGTLYGTLHGTADNADGINIVQGNEIKLRGSSSYNGKIWFGYDAPANINEYIFGNGARNDGLANITAAGFNGALHGTADNSSTLNGYTAAQLIGETSHATNGYHKFPDGTIIQWGNFSATTYGFATISFPIAFPTACLNVQKTSTNNNDDSGSERYLEWWNKTSFRTGIDRAGCTWFAIGY